MKFFTKELWRTTQGGGHIDETNRRWDQAAAEYQSQLEALRSRLAADAFGFFSHPDVHDGEVLEFATFDDSRGSRLDRQAPKPPSPVEHPVRANLTVLDVSYDYVWRLSYANVRRLLLDWPSAEPMFYGNGDGFGDWGYHELTEADNGFLRHEILFASGGTLLLEFGTIDVSRSPRIVPLG